MVIDLTISGSLLLLAAGAIFSARSLAGILLFIAFGLVVSLAWVRLQAVDLALAEAAIGAGLTGTLLLFALAQRPPEKPSRSLGWPRWAAAAVPAVALAVVLLATLPDIQVFHAAREPVPLALMAEQHLEASGVTHPVTAVLLNFRAWDTLLELAVLLLALLGIRQLQPSPPVVRAEPWPLLLAWSKILAPLLFIVAAYLLWRGKSAPGGAFQAGALLAAGAVLLRLTHVLPPLKWQHWPVRALLVLGVMGFLCVAILGLWLGNGWLHYPRAYSGALILVMESAASLSIALALALMIAGDEEDFQR